MLHRRRPRSPVNSILRKCYTQRLQPPGCMCVMHPDVSSDRTSHRPPSQVVRCQITKPQTIAWNRALADHWGHDVLLCPNTGKHSSRRNKRDVRRTSAKFKNSHERETRKAWPYLSLERRRPQWKASSVKCCKPRHKDAYNHTNHRQPSYALKVLRWGITEAMLFSVQIFKSARRAFSEGLSSRKKNVKVKKWKVKKWKSESRAEN